MTPTQEVCYDKYRMLCAEARAVKRLCGGNSLEMNKKLKQVADAIAEYGQSQPK